MANDHPLKKIKDKLDARLNDILCEMKPRCDDSIVGFNEAWDIVRKVFDEEIDAPAAAPPAVEWRKIERDLDEYFRSQGFVPRRDSGQLSPSCGDLFVRPHDVIVNISDMARTLAERQA